MTENTGVVLSPLPLKQALKTNEQSTIKPQSPCIVRLFIGPASRGVGRLGFFVYTNMSPEDKHKIKNKIFDLEAELEELKLENGKIIAYLSSIKNNIRIEGIMPDKKYKAYCDEQNKYRQKRLETESKISQIKLKIKKLHDDIFFSDQKQKQLSIENDTIQSVHVKKLVELRQKHQEFSADHTRVSSMRKMSAQFALELNSIIKGIINK